MGSATVMNIVPQPALGGAGCGHCAHSVAGPVCTQAEPAALAGAPRLQGPPELLQRVLAALERELGQPGVPAERWVQALRLGPGEAELTLAVGRLCGGRALADRAFHALRAVLPDTDIYVLHGLA